MGDGRWAMVRGWWLKNRRPAVPTILYVTVGALLVFGYGADASTCLFRAVTGHPCPGCGMTHALIALACGDWRAAWQFNPNSYAVAPIVIWTGIGNLKRSL